MTLKAKRSISRRAFVKLSAQLITLIAYSKSIKVALSKYRAPSEFLLNATDSVSTPLQPTPRPYGRGLYGRGVYPGYRTYIPLVNKEQE